ncbi:hypothetical protein GSI_03003 [Ganoderma sinense ZZ0214-1]|uniref:Mid2 domain-containing protein n=1 Tax=Ganoderma sinense ZZ0214-1 TaxID=1077348 RepID=A0A2G8SNB3_9APHY|nr:hypothetical protein GSI_03003 [Ganoderma sinense ZZ0214-1]
MTTMPALGEWLVYTFLTLTLSTRAAYGAAKSNTTCASTQLDWYTDAVGETPCVTYQRLRQICNSDYQVQKFNSLTPGDTCDDQLKDCCCNSVSFALSMLCMNCQYDSASDTSGIDAGDGAYEIYAGSCLKSAINQTLPDDVQSAVCNKRIKIDRNLYSLFWNTGAWFYKYTKDTITEDLAATNNNTFTHCASTTVNATTTKAGSGTATSSTKAQAHSTTASSKSQSSGSNTAAIVGGAVGGVFGAIALGLVGFCLWRKKRQGQGPKPLDLSGEYQYKSETQPGQFGAITPFSAPSTQDLSSRGGPESTFGASASEMGSGTGSGIASGSTPSTTALVGPGAASVISGRPSKFAGREGPSAYGFDEDFERHQDGGPATFLHRSASGRLPPAYQSWDEEPNDMSSAASMSQYQPHSVVGSSVGVDPYGAASVAGSTEPVVPPPPLPEPQQYPRDVKRPLPS